MKTPEEFDVFLRDTIAPRLRAIESERRAYQARRDALAVPAAWKIGAGVAGLVLSVLTKDVLPVLAGVFAPWVVEAIRKARVPDTATPMVRNAILQPVIQFWDPSFRYEPRGSVSRAEFEASRLFADAAFNTFAGEDLVSGRHGATEFRFSELSVKQVKREKNRTDTKLVFHGLFFVADFNKSFRGQTLVLPDLAERTLGSFGRAFQSLASGTAGNQLVELESPEFERAFVVRSSDPVEARYLLSPSLMQRILQFHQNTGAKLRLGFVGGRVFVAVPLPGDLFALNAQQPLSLTEIRRWAGELLFATSIVDELDLNTRVWSKAPAA